MTTAILITARLKSTRLPFKAIKEIKGRPMICHLIDRLKLSQRSEGMVLCTSTVDQDDPLVEIAKQEQIDCFRGDPEDVLLRVTNAAEEFGVTTVVSCTADNPFVDPEVIDQMLEHHAAEHNDFTSSQGLPLGTAGYVVSTSAMRRACDLKDETNTEIWGPMFTETGHFLCGVFKVDDPRIRWPGLRLTVDTPADFELITKIFEELYQPERIFSLSEIVALCHKRPDLVAINATVQQRPGFLFKLKSEQKSI